MQIFELYRYQLLPSSQQQSELFDEPLTADQIRQRKNIFLNEVLENLPHFRHRGMEIKHKSIFHEGNIFAFKVGAHKSIDRDTADFSRERIENWPNVTVLVNNDPSAQIIAVSRNQKAFASTKTVVNLFESSISPAIRRFGLTIQVMEQFEENNFWALIDENKGHITRVRFEMISPNMANISKALKIDLRQLNRETNCQKTNIELETVDGIPLEISRENKLIDGCVEYASMGGGDIAIKIKGIAKEVRTSTTVKTVAIDEVVLEGNGQDLLGHLKELLGG